MATLVMKPRSDNKPCGSAIESALKKVGSGLQYDKIFFRRGIYPVDISLDCINSGSTISAEDGAVIKLIDDAPKDVFKPMMPVFGQAKENIANALVENLTFEGNGKNQLVLAGDGFHNFLWFQNATNIEVKNIKIRDSKGDGLRVTNGSKIFFHDNNIYRCGHDGFYCDGGMGIEAWNNKINLRTNSGLRLRGVINGYLHDNEITNELGWEASSPGSQIENSRGKKSSNILIKNNLFKGMNGPGVWAIGVGNTDPSAASGLTLQGNIFENCGRMKKEHKISCVGGFVGDGWDKVLIENCTFDNCKGYAIAFGNYRGAASGKGYTALVRRNIITNTSPSAYQGVASGAPIANLINAKYSVTAEENCLFNNKTGAYSVESTGEILEDPHYVDSLNSDYRLCDDSPCVFADYELGRYAGTPREKPKLLPSVVIPKQTEEELLAYVQTLKAAGFILETDKISFLNMGSN